MALTRKQLKGMGLTDEQIDAIIEGHTESIEGLKNQIEALQGGQKVVEKSSKKDAKEDYSEEYKKLKQEYEDYKKEASAKELKRAKEDALKSLLKDSGLNQHGIEKAIKYTDVSKFDLDDDGKIKDSKKLVESLKEEWADYVVETKTQGVNTKTPAMNVGGSKKTKEEIDAIKDPVERQNAMLENIDLYNN